MNAVLALAMHIGSSFCVMLGLARPRRLVRLLVLLAIGPVLVQALWGVVSATFMQVSLPTQALMLIGAPVAAAPLIAFWLPRSLRQHIVGSAVYDPAPRAGPHRPAGRRRSSSAERPPDTHRRGRCGTRRDIASTERAGWTVPAEERICVSAESGPGGTPFGIAA